MCDVDDTISNGQETHQCVNSCNDYCSLGNLIPVEILLQYRSVKKPHYYSDEIITYYFCKRHYEWMLTLNNGLPFKTVQGKDKYDALDCFNFTNTYDYVSGNSNTFTFLREKEKEDGSNKYKRKVILVNESIENIKLEEKYEVKGCFHFDREYFIELIPLSYELTDFFKQKDFFYFKINDKEDRMYRIYFHSDENDDGITNDADYDDCDENDKHYFDTLYSFLEKRNNFEDNYNFIQDNMKNEIIQFEEKNKEYTFRHMIMLENALNNPNNSINLLTMINQKQITSELLWITYVKYNHYNNHTNPIQLKDNKMLISLIIKTFTKDELKLFLQYAIEGCRTYVTYRMKDFYDYIHPNLTAVKLIVPTYIDYMEEILCDFQLNTSIKNDENDENDEKNKKEEIEKVRRPLMFNVMLDFWNKSENYTMSYYPDRGDEHHYYDKDDSIREYLESLKSL
jgi:hypothetical protein